jgi:hypothetical protein
MVANPCCRKASNSNFIAFKFVGAGGSVDSSGGGGANGECVALNAIRAMANSFAAF